MRQIKICCIVLLCILIAIVSHLFLTEMFPQHQNYIERLIPHPQIKIFVTYYKPHEVSYDILKGKELLVPIQVGRAVEREPFMGGQLSDEDILWLHERMIGDDTGDNISAKNREFDVLTAYYWVWKHYKEIGNPEYVGFMAHRKWLSFQELNKYLLGINSVTSERGLLKLLDEHKVVSYTYQDPVAFENIIDIPLSVYGVYKKVHNEDDLVELIKVIEQNYPEMLEEARDVLYTHNKKNAVWNFWIMDKELAFEYFEKLFHVMSEVEKRRGDDIKKRDLRQRRAYGYLAERFFAIWLEYKSRQGLKPYYADLRYL